MRVVHRQPLDELPQPWRRFWRHVLSDDARRVYLALRELDGKEIDEDLWIASMGMTKGRYVEALNELKERGFIEY